MINSIIFVEMEMNIQYNFLDVATFAFVGFGSIDSSPDITLH